MNGRRGGLCCSPKRKPPDQLLWYIFLYLLLTVARVPQRTLYDQHYLQSDADYGKKQQKSNDSKQYCLLILLLKHVAQLYELASNTRSSRSSQNMGTPPAYNRWLAELEGAELGEEHVPEKSVP
ncbi:hypothetical protein BIW11_03244 [Tropilaelaps mercedesae]|uniref:Uncharacterized protein n=1 Tax=Tropilaelaps mercedesae TaxID=418985 RepID=A0A1V9XQ59_9ACAR|nr:hypothetical protein BIW11_03244 [Tropilaelaps mercedesae]